MAASIRLLTTEDLAAYVAHIGRHALESGQDGDPIFMPYGDNAPMEPEKNVERREKSWAIPVGEPEWARCWGVFDGHDIVGHCELGSMFLMSAIHRAGLGMGLQRGYRRQGHGRTLLETTIDFARTLPFLDWIDLGVFYGNDPAIALYLAYGFEEMGRVPDRFRVNGRQVGDISMSLNVASPNS